MRNALLILFFIFPGLPLYSQPGEAVPTLTLTECYQLAEQHYPIIKQREFISGTAAYTIENINKGYLPQVNVNGQATYQSAVTEIPISLPGAEIPALSKDQYKLYGEVSQVIYDGGTLKYQKELQKAEENIEQQKLSTELYSLKDRINQLFFGALYIEEQLKQNELVISDIQAGLNKMEAAVRIGTVLRSQADLLKADLLKTKQRTTELQASLSAYRDMLGLFTGKQIDGKTRLIKPAPAILTRQINRPELSAYQAENAKLDVQSKMLRSKVLPRLNLFFQGGLGRPALNMLSNDFEAYYIGGAKLTWSISTLYTAKKDRALIGIRRNVIENRNETFLFNTTLSMKQSDAEIKKYQELLHSDDEIITLRNKVKIAAVAQLDNGVITGNDYMREVIAEDQARQSKILHEIQLLISQYNFQTATGNQQ